MSTTKPARTVATPGEVSTTRPADTADTQATAAHVAPLDASPDFDSMSKEELAAHMKTMHAQMADTHRLAMDMHKQLRAKDAPSMPEAVKHPSLKEVMASNPDKATMTEEGIYVPRVTSSNPEQQLVRRG